MSVLTAAGHGLKPGLARHVLGGGSEEEGQLSPPWAPGQHRAALPAVERGVPESRAALGTVRAPGVGARPHACWGPLGGPLHTQRVPVCIWVLGWRVTLDVLFKWGSRVAFFLLECGKDPISEAGLETHGSTAWASL